MCFFASVLNFSHLKGVVIMKKIIILLLTVSMIAASFMGCTGSAFGSSSADTNGNGLRDDVELEIMEASHNADSLLKNKEFSPSNFTVEYFGTYNGAVAVRITCKGLLYLTAFYTEMVGEVEFTYGNSNKITIWANGEFCSLSKAYRDGILTDADVEAIHSAFVKK